MQLGNVDSDRFFVIVIKIDFESHSVYTSLASGQFCTFNCRSKYLEQKKKEHAMKKKAGKKEASNAKAVAEGEQKV